MHAVMNGCEAAGLEIVAVNGGRGHRAGVGIGRPGQFTAVWFEELRDRIPLTDAEIEDWLASNPKWGFLDWRLRRDGSRACANGRLRLLLARRYGPSPDPRVGWRWSFTDQVGRPLEEQSTDAVAALVQRCL